MTKAEAFTNEEIASSDIPCGDNLAFEPIEQNYRTMLTVTWYGIMAVVIIANTVASILTDSLPYLWQGQYLPWTAGALLLLGVVGLLTPHILWQTKGFRIRTHDIHYRDGVIWQKVTSLPFARIQHVELESGPLQRLFKLTTLKFYSAGGGSADMKIPGLRFGVASKIRSTVMRSVNENSNENGEDLPDQGETNTGNSDD